MKFVLLISCLGFHSVLSHRLGDGDEQDVFHLLDGDSLGRKDAQEIGAEVYSDVNHTGVRKIASNTTRRDWPHVGRALRAFTGSVAGAFPRTVNTLEKVKKFMAKHKKAIYTAEKVIVGVTLLAVSLACPACAAGVLVANLAFTIGHAIVDTYFNAQDKQMTAGQVLGSFVFTLAVGTVSQVFAFGVDFGLTEQAASILDLVDGICGCVGDAIGAGGEVQQKIKAGDPIRADIEDNTKEGAAEVEAAAEAEEEFTSVGGITLWPENGDEADDTPEKISSWYLDEAEDAPPTEVAVPELPKLVRQNGVRNLFAADEPKGQLPQSATALKKAMQDAGIAFQTFAGDAADYFLCSGITAVTEAASAAKS